MSQAQGFTALASALTTMMDKAGLGYVAVYVPPPDDSVDGDITFTSTAGTSPITLQVGPYGGALYKSECNEGEITAITMLRSFDQITTRDVCEAVVAELKK